MLCIFIFIIFLFLFPIFGLFPQYRVFFRKSWKCVWTKMQLKPCDVDLGEEIKNKTVGWLLFRAPKLARFVEKTFSFWAFSFVALNIFSLLYTLNAGLNLYVYDTCNPTTTEGCALSGDSCEVGIATISFSDALAQNNLGEWATQPFVQFGETISRVPDRLKTWNGDDYLGDNPSYYSFDKNNSTALEIIDPGCPSCKKLFNNIKEADFASRYNVTYILYPIPSQSSSTGYRFNNSLLLSKYIIALQDADTESIINPDWLFLEYLFTARHESDYDMQFMFSQRFEPNSQEAIDQIHTFLTEIGYTDAQIQTIAQNAESEAVMNQINNDQTTVEDKIRTIKIPTIMYDGRRYDRVVNVDELKK